MKNAYNQGLECDHGDDEGGDDDVSPKDVGHNIYILAHQVSHFFLSLYCFANLISLILCHSWLAVNTFKIWSFHLFSACVPCSESREEKAPRVPLGLWSELFPKKTVLGTKNWASKEERIPCQSLRNRYPWQQMEVWKQRGQRLLRRQRV